jgi:hypothetical protein
VIYGPSAHSWKTQLLCQSHRNTPWFGTISPGATFFLLFGINAAVLRVQALHRHRVGLTELLTRRGRSDRWSPRIR